MPKFIKLRYNGFHGILNVDDIVGVCISQENEGFVVDEGFIIVEVVLRNEGRKATIRVKTLDEAERIVDEIYDELKENK